MKWLLALACMLVPRLSHARPADLDPLPDTGSDSDDDSDDQKPAPPPPPDLTAPEELLDRIDALEQAQAKLGRIQESTNARVTKLMPLLGFINVFIDVGAFAVGGNGSGIRSDVDHLYYPKYADQIAGQWVFMGDPLATTINSLGEPADTSDSREDKVDTIHSGGHPSLIANSLGLTIRKEVDAFTVVGLVEVLPRPGQSILDVELAHIEYRPSARDDLVIFAGKIDSVLGVEYRSQDATRRLGVTPSLICRYTCGRPIGVEARYNAGAFSTSAALTDGDSFDDRFEPDTSLKSNRAPTGSGHFQYKLPFGQGLELGVSGAVGPQDGQPDDSLVQWHYGFDARLIDLDLFDVTAEFVQGRQPGAASVMTPCAVAQCLTYKGAYVLVDHRGSITPYVRVDWRDAVHRDGVEFVYESHELRATVGVNAHVTDHVTAKIEYSFNRELGATPEFPDDVLTSSIVVNTQ